MTGRRDERVAGDPDARRDLSEPGRASAGENETAPTSRSARDESTTLPEGTSESGAAVTILVHPYWRSTGFVA